VTNVQVAHALRLSVRQVRRLRRRLGTPPENAGHPARVRVRGR
jgi:hypothetical protein